MDAMDILGALLGRKTKSGGSGGSVLKDMLGGGRKPAQRAPSNRAPSGRAPSQRPQSIEESAQSLEDLLNVANDHHNNRRETPSQRPPRSAPPRQSPPASRRAPLPTPPSEPAELNDQAVIMIRAMINAAKSDGKIDQAEQDAILKQVDHVGDEEIRFLQQEFAAELDVRDFAWSVPMGMEEQVYSLSLLAIELDENKEAQYLGELAHGLRISPARCNEIHRKFRLPEIFRV